MLELEAFVIDKRSVDNDLKECFEQTEIIFKLVENGEQVKFLKTGEEIEWWREKYNQFDEPIRDQKCVVKIDKDKFNSNVEYPVEDFYVP